jgi:alanyl-tRNA synthetase
MGKLIRAVNTQKSIINANDYVELEEVGRGDQKLTFGDELSAFSFGDYSKVGFNFNI